MYKLSIIKAKISRDKLKLNINLYFTIALLLQKNCLYNYIS